MEIHMTLNTIRYAMVGTLLLAGVTGGASAQDTPILDMVANNVIAKYQNASCEELWEQKGQPKTAEQQQVIQMLQNDPQMRATFIDKIAAPIANKLFSCGMIP
jgi:hypothetical protein